LLRSSVRPVGVKPGDLKLSLLSSKCACGTLRTTRIRKTKHLSCREERGILMAPIVLPVLFKIPLFVRNDKIHLSVYARVSFPKVKDAAWQKPLLIPDTTHRYRMHLVHTGPVFHRYAAKQVTNPRAVGGGVIRNSPQKNVTTQRVVLGIHIAVA